MYSPVLVSIAYGDGREWQGVVVDDIKVDGHRVGQQVHEFGRVDVEEQTDRYE